MVECCDDVIPLELTMEISKSALGRFFMDKSQITPEFKFKLCKKHLSGVGSGEGIAESYGIGATTFRNWIQKYQAQVKDCHKI